MFSIKALLTAALTTVLTLLVLSYTQLALAAKPLVVVLYPDVRAPYDKIFEDVITGIKKASSAKVKKMPLKRGTTPDKAVAWVNTTKPDVVITLGSRGKKIAKELTSQYPVISGSTFFSNDAITSGSKGIALSPSPEKLFAKLRAVSSQVKRISIVYHEPTNGWLIGQAQASAKKYNFELAAYPAENIRDAAQKYRQILANQANGDDAIWLLQGDPTLDERGLLPTLLSDAWASHSIVFSSNPSHVSRGALFSLYPDNQSMGKSLWRLYERSKAKAVGVEPLEDLLAAINTRTAEHLNIDLGRSELREYQLVFPVR